MVVLTHLLTKGGSDIVTLLAVDKGRPLVVEAVETVGLLVHKVTESHCQRLHWGHEASRVTRGWHTIGRARWGRIGPLPAGCTPSPPSALLGLWSPPHSLVLGDKLPSDIAGGDFRGGLGAGSRGNNGRVGGGGSAVAVGLSRGGGHGGCKAGVSKVQRRGSAGGVCVVTSRSVVVQLTGGKCLEKLSKERKAGKVVAVESMDLSANGAADVCVFAVGGEERCGEAREMSETRLVAGDCVCRR